MTKEKESDKKNEVEPAGATVRDTSGPMLKLFKERTATIDAEKRERLLSVLSGKIQFYVKGSKERFYLEFQNNEISFGSGIDKDPDCTVTITESDIEGIAEDSLNPQIAMISDKVTVEGKTSLAIYAFNLITRQN